MVAMKNPNPRTQLVRDARARAKVRSVAAAKRKAAAALKPKPGRASVRGREMLVNNRAAAAKRRAAAKKVVVKKEGEARRLKRKGDSAKLKTNNDYLDRGGVHGPLKLKPRDSGGRHPPKSARRATKKRKVKGGLWSKVKARHAELRKTDSVRRRKRFLNPKRTKR